MTVLPRLIPDAEQETAIQQMVNSPSRSALNASEIGSGKSVMTVETALRLGAKTILIICPLGTRVGWERTFRRQGWTLPIQRITSRKDGKQAFEDLASSVPGVYLVGREYFRRLNWKGVTPDFACADECHFFQSRRSKSFATIKQLKADYRMCLSGTFFGNKFPGAWSVTRWLFPEHVDVSFWRWVDQWAIKEVDRFAGVIATGEKKPGAFVKSLPCYVRLTPKRSTEVVEETRYVELTAAQRKMYDSVEKDMLVWLGDHPEVMSLPVVQRIRLRQAALGVFSLGPEDEILFENDCKSSKIDALKEILDDLDDEPVLILTHSKRFARVVTHRLGSKAAAWTGDTSHEDRERLLTTFGRFNGPQYLVATIAALGEGIDGLQEVCSTVVWLSRDENELLNRQVLGRLDRQGQTKNVRSIDIVAVDTLDEGIIHTLEETYRSNQRIMEKSEVLA